MLIDNVVLGAGVAGLSAAYTARQAGRRAVVFEARSRPGGLLDNFTVEGFRFDTAVHLSFATEAEVREVFDRTPYYTHAPEALCWDAGRWLKHPVQNNLYPLTVDEKVELIAGLAHAQDGAVANYRDWLVQQYGQPIAGRWPLLYTEKYWTVPAERLGTDWVGQRMRRADIGEVLRGALTADTPNQYYAKEMRYPKQGGYKAFIEPLIEGAEIVYDHRVVAVDPVARTVRFQNGASVSYSSIVSTLPLPRLVEMIDVAPDEVRRAADTLFATQVDLISVAFNRPSVSPALWFYIYDRDIAAARAYAPDWKSPDNVPDGCSSLQFEIYSSRESSQRLTPDELKADTVRALLKMGIASEQDILFVHHHHVPYANVVFDLGMEARRDLVLAWLRAQGVHSAGRFGEWAYLWSNQSFMSGRQAAQLAFAG
jgi:protoporphyrinogen oxidase